MLRQLKTGRKLATTLCFLTLGLMALLYMGRQAAEAAPPAASILSRALPGAPAASRWRDELAWSRVREDGAGFVQVLHDGGRVELTLDPRLQHDAERVLAENPAPYAAAVMLSVDDGRVLALAGRSQHRASSRGNEIDLALKPWAPAASIFKLVTAVALVESGLSTDTRVCYHDGVHSVESSNLTAHPRWDLACNSFAFGMAKSQNAIIARLAHEHLDPLALLRTAHAFGFGAPLPFELELEPSSVTVPERDELAFARTAAGFQNTTLSPMHGAYLAATLARGGVTPSLRLVDQVVDRAGNSFRPDGSPERRVISGEAARAITRMMVGTTEFGTARLGFHDRQGHPVLPGVVVAGKTGSLNRPLSDGPFLSYSWFVGFAPAERPEVAVAVLMGNGENWHKKASNLAAELLSHYFHGAPSLQPTLRCAQGPSPSNRRLASR